MSLSLFLSLSLSLFLSLSLSLSLSFSLSLSLSLPLTSPSLSLPLSVSPSLYLSFYFSHCFSVSSIQTLAPTGTGPGIGTSPLSRGGVVWLFISWVYCYCVIISIIVWISSSIWRNTIW